MVLFYFLNQYLINPKQDFSELYFGIFRTYFKLNRIRLANQ